MFLHLNVKFELDLVSYSFFYRRSFIFISRLDSQNNRQVGWCVQSNVFGTPSNPWRVMVGGGG